MPKIIYRLDFSPEGKGEEFEFDGADGSVRIGASERCHVKIPRGEKVAEDHLQIDWDEKERRYSVTNISKVEVVTDSGSLRHGARKKLGEECVFFFGQTTQGEEIEVTYQDDAAFVKPRAITFSSPEQNEQEVLIADFYRGLSAKNLNDFPNYLVNFIKVHFPPVMTISYVEKKPGKWNIEKQSSRKGIKAHKPSVSLLSRLASEKKPQYFDVEFDSKQSSLSLIANKVQQAFFFPLIVGDDVIAGLYIDTPIQEKGKRHKKLRNRLTKKDFFQIDYLLSNGVSAVLMGLEQGARLNYPLQDTRPKFPFTVGLSRAYPNMIFAYRREENHYVFYIGNAKKENTAYLVKSHLDGFLDAKKFYSAEECKCGEEHHDPDISNRINRLFKVPFAEIRITVSNHTIHIWIQRTEKGFWIAHDPDGKGLEEVTFFMGFVPLRKGNRLVVRPDSVTKHSLLEIHPR